MTPPYDVMRKSSLYIMKHPKSKSPKDARSLPVFVTYWLAALPPALFVAKGCEGVFLTALCVNSFLFDSGALILIKNKIPLDSHLTS